jgi:hypothetical protein
MNDSRSNGKIKCVLSNESTGTSAIFKIVHELQYLEDIVSFVRSDY